MPRTESLIDVWGEGFPSRDKFNIDQSVGSLTEAINLIDQAPSNTHFNIAIPLEGNFKVRVQGNRFTDNEQAILRFSKLEGSAKRTVEGHHGVSTDYEESCYLIVKVSPHEDPVLDRGICWVYSGSPGTLLLHIFKKGDVPREFLEQAVVRARDRTTEVISDIVNGKPEENYNLVVKE